MALSDTSLIELETLVRTKDRDRFFLVMTAPKARRAALLALLAFDVTLAEVRSSVSEPVIGQMRFAWWRDVLKAMEEGRDPPKGHPICEALPDLFEHTGVPPGDLIALVDAREEDLVNADQSGADSVLTYAQAVHGHVMRLIAQILGETEDGSLRAATDLGVAHGVALVLRALPHEMTPEQGALAKTAIGTTFEAAKTRYNAAVAQDLGKSMALRPVMGFGAVVRKRLHLLQAADLDVADRAFQDAPTPVLASIWARWRGRLRPL